MSSQFRVPCFTLSVWCVVFSVLVMSLLRPCVPPSLPDLRISGGGMGSWGNAMSLPPSSPHFWWCSAQVPWALCPYLSPQVEHLENPLKSGCWHCCFSVSKAHEYLKCIHEPRKYLQMNNQIRPAKYTAKPVELHFIGLQALPFAWTWDQRKIPE